MIMPRSPWLELDRWNSDQTKELKDSTSRKTPTPNGLSHYSHFIAHPYTEMNLTDYLKNLYYYELLGQAPS